MDKQEKDFATKLTLQLTDFSHNNMKELITTVEDVRILNILYGIILVFGIWATGLHNPVITLFVICLFSYLLFDLNTKKIIIDKEGVHYKTIFKKDTIRWENIKLYTGLIVKYGSGVARIDKESLINKKGFFRKMIVISTLPYEALGIERNPLQWSRKNNCNYIGFTYRKEALDLVELYISDNQLKLSYTDISNTEK